MLLALMLNLSRYARWPLGLSLVLTVGCIDHDERPDPAELRGLIETHCERAEACSCDAGNVAATCSDDLTDRWNTRVREGEERGLTFDSECFATLSADVENTACEWINNSEQLCTRYCAVYYGVLQAGDACSSFDSLVSNCAQGLTCSDGVCAEPCAALSGRTEGEPCATQDVGRYDDCAIGLSCDNQTGVCTALSVEGDLCSGGNDCGLDLVCDQDSQRCVAAPGEGERCDFGVCADGLDCAWQSDDQRYCQARALEGEPCTERRCSEELICNQASTCQVRPSAGSPCVYGECALGATCDFETDLCRELPLEGEPCLFNDCDFGLWCQSTSDDPEGTCRAPIATGEMCSGHSQCASGFCPNGFCWPRALEGDDCSDGTTCGVGLVCNGFICEPTPSRAPAVCTYAGW